MLHDILSPWTLSYGCARNFIARSGDGETTADALPAREVVSRTASA